jgi:hypothetical protein
MRFCAHFELKSLNIYRKKNTLQSQLAEENKSQILQHEKFFVSFSVLGSSE